MLHLKLKLKHMKHLLILGILLVAVNSSAQRSTGDVIGTVINFKNKEPLLRARMIIDDNGSLYQAFSDPDGRFRIPSVPSGKYYLTIIYKADTMRNIALDVPIEAYCNLGTIEFEAKTLDLKVVNLKAGIRLVHGELPVKELTDMEIKRSPVKFDVKTLATTMSSEVRMADDGELMFRGARKGDMIYVLDGIKSNEVFNVPSCAIGKMMVYTGGLPAKYGDTLGGAIILETKSYFDLYRSYQQQYGED